MKAKIPESNVELECVRGDITKQENIQAIVNAANANLTHGGGVAGAINKAAGPHLAKESEKLAPIKPGQAVVTKGYELSNDYVIHCLGPIYGKDKPEDEILKQCYKNALDKAEELEIESIAFPAISTGVFKYPIQEASMVSIEAIKEKAPELKKVKTIRFVLWGWEDFDEYKKAVRRVIA